MSLMNALLPILNAAVFVTQFFVPGKEIRNQSAAYTTILTPAGPAFSIWGVIYGLQLIFVIYGLTPVGMGSPVIQKGVFIWYIISSLASSGWIILFTRDLPCAAHVSIMIGWAALVLLYRGVYVQRILVSRSLNFYRLDFWTTQVPFALNLGWMTGALILSTNIVVIAKYRDHPSCQLAAAVLSLVLIVLAVFVMTFVLKWPEPVYAFAVIWFLSWLAWTLREGGGRKLPDWATPVIIEAFRIAAIFLAVLTALFTARAMLVRMAEAYFLYYSDHSDRLLSNEYRSRMDSSSNPEVRGGTLFV